MSALQDRLRKDGLWASDEDILASLSWARYGIESPVVTWTNAHPEVAYSPHAELVTIAREVDHVPGSVQLRPPSTGITRPTLAYYRDGGRTYTPLHPDLRVTKIVARNGRVLITSEVRSAATKGEESASFVASLTSQEAIDFIEGRLPGPAPGLTALETSYARTRFLRRKSEK